MNAMTFTANQVLSASLSELRELAKQCGITVRHPETKKPRTVEQYRAALIQKLPAKVEKPAPKKASKPAKAADLSRLGKEANREDGILLEALEGVATESIGRPGTKKADFLAALERGATAEELDTIIGTNKGTIWRFCYYVCRECCKSYGVEVKGGIYKLVKPAA